MGNVPAKESRSRSHSQASATSLASGNSPLLPAILSSLGGSRSRARSHSGAFSLNNPNLLGILSSNSVGSTAGGLLGGLPSDRKKRQEEKDRQKEQHYLDLVVRYHENVDGGYLAPYGTYKSNLDFNTEVVRSLIIGRRLAPFYTPLQDFDLSWSDSELVVLLSQLTLHLIETAYSDEEDEEDVDSRKLHKSANYYRRQEQKARLKQIVAAAKEAQKQEEQVFLEDKMRLKSNLVSYSQLPDLPSRDLLLALYRNASECPICFLYFPLSFNISRCCHQPICSECFVQIKRLDPHPPHDDPSQTSSNPNETPHTLISEAANCPFCAMPDFGVTYNSFSHISTGIEGMTKPGMFKAFANIPEDDSVIDDSTSSPTGSSSMSPQRRSRISNSSPAPARRRSSLAASDPSVITIDMIRPDWELKLLSARNRLARKAATATAIHASNLLIDNGGSARRNSSASQSAGVLLRTMEDRMIEEALRLSLIDEEERKRKAQEEEQKKGK